MNITHNKERRKVVFLGDSGAGKTSIIQKKIKDKYQEHQTSTIGAAFTTYHRGNTVLDIWDTAGQERYRSLAPMYYRGSNCAVIVFDLAKLKKNKNAILNVKSWVSTMKEAEIPYIIIGNKIDQFTKTINDRHFETYSDINKIEYISNKYDIYFTFFLTSAKTGHHIDHLFDQVIIEADKHYKHKKELLKTTQNAYINIVENKDKSYYQKLTGFC